MDTRTARITVSDDVAHDRIDGEVVAIQLSTGVYFSLVGLGADVWDAMVRGTDVTTVTETLHAAFPGATDLPEAVLALVDELLQNGLVTSTPATGLPAAAPTLSPSGLETLRVEAFTDMQDLLLLDPVHDVDAEVGWPAVDPSATER